MDCRIPPLDRKDVRQALAFALDKKRLARAFPAASSLGVVHNYIPADLPGFFPLKVDNPARQKRAHSSPGPDSREARGSRRSPSASPCRGGTSTSASSGP